MEDLRQNFRRMYFAFPGRAPVDEMSLAGVRNSQADGHVLSLVVDSNFEEITRRASALGAISANVQSVNLRELFLEVAGTRVEDK